MVLRSRCVAPDPGDVLVEEEHVWRHHAAQAALVSSQKRALVMPDGEEQDIAGLEEALPEAEQNSADVDQILSDSDQTGSEHDQISSDRDQAAADIDQATSDGARSSAATRSPMSGHAGCARTARSSATRPVVRAAPLGRARPNRRARDGLAAARDMTSAARDQLAATSTPRSSASSASIAGARRAHQRRGSQLRAPGNDGWRPIASTRCAPAPSGRG